ncbi:MAG: DUF3347 domain-containing protein [Cyclobacteriaceae bacterium]|nr:DUF3347 domain-containing protein [Cyclobacteriaceae bacterium]
MKKQIVGFVFGALILPLGVMAQDHSHHEMSNDKKSMEHEGEQVKHFDVSADFQKQLNVVYQASLTLSNAFVASDANEAKSKAAAMSSAMKNVDMSLLTGDAHIAWMGYMKPINEGLKAISSSDDIKEQRKLYASVSEGLYKSVKAFGVGETVYYQHCPMAKSSWLSNSKDIKNPYYGSMMLTCGATKEVLTK